MVHALERIRERLTWAERQLCKRLLEEVVERFPKGSAAVVLMQVDPRGKPWSDESNGDLVVGILRDGRVVTVFMRRSTQPLEPEKFDTDQVLLMCEVVQEGV